MNHAAETVTSPFSQRGEQLLLVSAGVRNRSSDKANLALIRAFKVNGICRRLSSPIILTVFGPAKDCDPNDECAFESSKVWSLSSSDQVASISIETFSLIDALDDAEEKGISGGIKISNVRYENGKIRGDIKVWAKIKVLGASAKLNETFSFSIHAAGCHTVFDAGIGKVKLCFKAPNKLCAELCVGKWGIEKCWDECVEINMINSEIDKEIGLGCDCSGN